GPIGGPEIPAEQAPYVAGDSLQPIHGPGFLVLRNPRLERKAVASPADLHEALAETPEADRRPDQVLEGVLAMNSGLSCRTAPGKRSDGMPALRQREANVYFFIGTQLRDQKDISPR